MAVNSHVRIKKEENDPICLRASIGGKDGDYYCVYRGDRQQTLEMLRETLKAFETYMANPEVDATPHSVKIRFGGS